MSTAAIDERASRVQSSARGRSTVRPCERGVGFEWATELAVSATVPPKPLPAILVALHQIPPGAPQYVRTPRRAMDLLAALTQRGIAVTEESLPDGTWRMTVISPARTAQ